MPSWKFLLALILRCQVLSVMPRITSKIEFHVHCLYMIMLLMMPPLFRVSLLASEACVLSFLLSLDPGLLVMA